MTETLNLNSVGSITCHTWNKDRSQIAISPNSKEVFIYAKTGNVWELSQTLSEHSSKVLSIDWAPQSNSIVTCGADKNAYVWSLDGRVWKPELVVLRINRAATCVKWSPNEKKFAVGCGHRCICVCYYEQNQGFWVAKHIKKQIRSTTLCLDWHPNNILIAAGGTDFKCRIFGAHVPEVDGQQPSNTPWGNQIKSADCIAEYSASNHGWVHACSFNLSGTLLAFVGHDSTIYVVNTETNVREAICLKTQFLPFLSLKFISNSTFLVAGHDCFPIVFSVNGNSIKYVEKMDVSSIAKQTNAISNARNMFGNRDRNNADETFSNSNQYVHQNSIKQISIYKQDGKKASHISTCSLDGNVVVWDLNTTSPFIKGMAITYVLKVAVPADQSIQQYKEILEKRLASLKPRRLNKFQVQTIVYQSSINQTSIHQFLHSDYPVTCFSIIEPISSSQSTSSVPINDVKVLTGDIGLASIQRRVSELGIFMERKPLQIECTGSAFKIGDFQIKIGAVTNNSTNRGLIIEISYSSENNNQEAYGIILEFIQNFFGWSNINDSMTNLVRRKPQLVPYTPEDTIIQYFEHFNNFRNFGNQQR